MDNKWPPSCICWLQMHNYLLLNFLSTFMSMIKDERCIWEKEKETTKQQFSLFRDNRSSWVVLSKHLLKNKDKDLFSKRKISKRNLNFNSKFSVLKQAATETADLDWWILITSKEKEKPKEKVFRLLFSIGLKGNWT